jgi:hypothetical protein
LPCLVIGDAPRLARRGIPLCFPQGHWPRSATCTWSSTAPERIPARCAPSICVPVQRRPSDLSTAWGNFTGLHEEQFNYLQATGAAGAFSFGGARSAARE